MKGRHQRAFGVLASTITAVALAAPVTAATGSGGGSAGTSSPGPANATLRNDIAHFGTEPGLSAPGSSNAILRNDVAHYGNRGRLSAQGSSRLQRESPAPIVVRVDGGFDWVSASVGAAGGCGLLLVAGAATSALRRRHRFDAAQA